MSMKCPNCGTSLGCSCQQRVAGDGTSCCSQCVTAYNIAHPVAKPAVKPKPSVNLKQPNTAPTDVTVVYKGPGHQV